MALADFVHRVFLDLGNVMRGVCEQLTLYKLHTVYTKTCQLTIHYFGNSGTTVADSLSFFNQNFMIGGIATWGVGISAYIILIVLRPKREKGDRGLNHDCVTVLQYYFYPTGSRLILSVALLIVGSIVIIASAVLWFAVALHIGLQSGKKISIGIYVRSFHVYQL